MYNLGVDLGGTNIVVGVVNDKHKIIAKGKRKTNMPRPAEEIFDDMLAAANDALEQAGLTMDDISSVGLGTPGAVDTENGIITYSANLFFHNVQARKLMQERFQKKAYIGNDANCAAFGEYIAGAGVGTHDMIAITLGTGVGSGIIINGKLLTGFNDAAGELGHMVIKEGGQLCNCGRRGCWETYASAAALSRMTKELYDKTHDEILGKAIEQEGEVNAKVAFIAARAGSKACRELTDIYAYYIAIGMANIINAFQPQVFCIGGGVSHEGKPLLDKIKRYVEEQSYTRDNPPEKQTDIRLAELGNDAGIIGAALMYLND